MLDDDQVARLREIAGRFVELNGSTLLGSLGPPFDVTKPNFHDTKADFLAEVAYVDQLLEMCEGLSETLAALYSQVHPQNLVANQVAGSVDDHARQSASRGQVEFFSDIVTLTAAKIGYTSNMAVMCLGMVRALSARKQELESQRSTFWNTRGRAPKHYARTIALRFAKLIAKKTGKKPTFGTSRDGSHPSTEYGRALEEIFGILGIEATVKHPATWAIKQLTEEDLRPERVGILANLLGGRSPDPMNPLAKATLGPAKESKQ